MKYITIPERALVKGVTRPNPETQEQEAVFYNLEALNEEFVWTSLEWRKDEATGRAFVRCMEAFEGKGPGDVVVLETEDFEKYKPIAMSAGANNPAVRPFMATMTKLLLSVAMASDKDPSKKVEPAPAPEEAAA